MEDRDLPFIDPNGLHCATSTPRQSPLPYRSTRSFRSMTSSSDRTEVTREQFRDISDDELNCDVDVTEISVPIGMFIIYFYETGAYFTISEPKERPMKWKEVCYYNLNPHLFEKNNHLTNPVTLNYIYGTKHYGVDPKKSHIRTDELLPWEKDVDPIIDLNEDVPLNEVYPLVKREPIEREPCFLPPGMGSDVGFVQVKGLLVTPKNWVKYIANKTKIPES